MTSFIFETIIEFSAAIRNVYAQLMLMNRGIGRYIYNANFNAVCGTRWPICSIEEQEF